MAIVDRTIWCRRALWVPPILMNLEKLLENALRPVPPENPEQTRRDFGDRKIEARHWRLESPLLLHIASWNEGVAASTVPHGKMTGDLDIQPAPPDSDYLRGDGMALVKDDYCLVMPSGITGPTIISYIREIIGYKGLQVAEVVSPDVLEMVNRKGIKRIETRIAGRMQPELGQKAPTTLRQRVGQFIRQDAFARGEDRERIRSASNVDARMVVQLDMSQPGLTPMEFASMLSREEEGLTEEGVTIVTGDGQAIREGNLVLRTKVSVDGYGHTVHHVGAWRALELYFQELQDQQLIV